MKKNKIPQIICAAALVLASLIGLVAHADTQADKATMTQGTNSTCGGTYYATAKMTNSTGSTWITPPTNSSSGTFTDASGFGAPYSSTTLVTRFSDKATWCGTNSVTFPAASSNRYSLSVLVTSPTPPPTNGQPLTLQIQWQ